MIHPQRFCYYLDSHRVRGLIIARLVGWPPMCGSTPGRRRRSSLPLQPSCSGKIIPRRRAESAATKSFRSTARWRFKNEGHALRIHQGGHQIASSANHSALKSITSSPTNNDLHRHQVLPFDFKRHLLASFIWQALHFTQFFRPTKFHRSSALTDYNQILMTDRPDDKVQWFAAKPEAIKVRIMQIIMVVKGCPRNGGLQSSKGAGY